MALGVLHSPPSQSRVSVTDPSGFNVASELVGRTTAKDPTLKRRIGVPPRHIAVEVALPPAIAPMPVASCSSSGQVIGDSECASYEGLPGRPNSSRRCREAAIALILEPGTSQSVTILLTRSPVKSRLPPASITETESGVCPGVLRSRTVRPPRSSVSPSLIHPCTRYLMGVRSRYCEGGSTKYPSCT